MDLKILSMQKTKTCILTRGNRVGNCLRAYFLYIRKTGKYFVTEQNKSYVVDPEVSMKGQVRKTVSIRDSKAQEHAEAVEQLIAPELL